MKPAKAAITALLFSMAFSAKAIELDATSGEVRGVTIVSADIASDLDSSAQMLVVRLRNRTAETGQPVTLALTVRDESGRPRGMHAKTFEIQAAPSGEQVVIQPLPDFTSTEDTLTIELVDLDEWARRSNDAASPE